jgi:hypothetical protein
MLKVAHKSTDKERIVRALAERLIVNHFQRLSSLYNNNSPSRQREKKSKPGN